MRRAMVLVFLMGAALIAACEPGGEAVALEGSANGLVGADAGEAADDTESVASESTATTTEVNTGGEKENEQPSGDDSATEVFSVSWTDGAEISTVSKVSFTVTNISNDEVISFYVSVLCRGLLGEAEKKAGTAELGPGESKSFKMSAAALPIRSAKVVSQMFVKVTRTVQQSDGEREVSMLVASRYVRHELGFAKVRAYTETQLESELGGVLFESELPSGETSAAALSGEVLGDKQQDGKKGVSVSLASSGLVDYDDAGNMLGIISEYSTGSADANAEGLILVYPEGSDAGAEEVDHD
jgi:hypothetical protein